jgi:transcription elongation GreA/GreB family factor
MNNLTKYSDFQKQNEVNFPEIDKKEAKTGNIITFNLYDHEEKETEMYTLKLVEHLKGGEKEISIYSPVGQNIYRKKIGESATYILNSRKFTVTIVNIEQAM